jgi:hypothetical protein
MRVRGKDLLKETLGLGRRQLKGVLEQDICVEGEGAGRVVELRANVIKLS